METMTIEKPTTPKQRFVDVHEMEAKWVEVIRGKVVDISPLWAFTDEYGNTIIQTPSKKYPTKMLEQLRNRKI